jgi:hypothetical protein
MQLVEPPTIKAIRFRTARDILDVASIDQGDLKAADLKNLKEWDPVHASGFHHDCRNPTGRSPVSETMQVAGKRAKWLDRLGIAICGDTPPMLFSPHIAACGMRMEDGHILGRRCVLLAFFGHTFLQSGEEGESKGRQGSY